MVRLFRLNDGSFAIETRSPQLNPNIAMTVDDLDLHAMIWEDDHFGTSITDNDGMARFIATVLTAAYFAARGSTPSPVDSKTKLSAIPLAESGRGDCCDGSGVKKRLEVPTSSQEHPEGEPNDEYDEFEKEFGIEDEDEDEEDHNFAKY